MNTKASIPFLSTAALAALLACSTPQSVAPIADAPTPVPPPEISFSLPLEEPEPESLPTFCTLGTTCLAMDPRPFEPCLLSAKNCRDKATEPLLVGQPEWIVPPPIIIKTR
jgi:hypothetical protein